MKLFILIITFIYSISRYFDIKDYGLYENCKWYNYITYNLIHLSFYHLICNSVFLILYWNILTKIYNKYIIIAITVISDIISSILFPLPKTTFGASGLLFSFLGLYISHIVHKKIPGYKKFVITSVLLIAIQSFIGNNTTNWHIHFSSLILSFIFSTIYVRFKRT